MRLHQIPGSSSHAVIDEETGEQYDFPNEAEARAFIASRLPREAEDLIDPVQEPSPKKKRKRKALAPTPEPVPEKKTKKHK